MDNAVETSEETTTSVCLCYYCKTGPKKALLENHYTPGIMSVFTIVMLVLSSYPLGWYLQYPYAFKRKAQKHQAEDVQSKATLTSLYGCGSVQQYSWNCYTNNLTMASL